MNEGAFEKKQSIPLTNLDGLESAIRTKVSEVADSGREQNTRENIKKINDELKQIGELIVRKIDEATDLPTLDEFESFLRNALNVPLEFGEGRAATEHYAAKSTYDEVLDRFEKKARELRSQAFNEI